MTAPTTALLGDLETETLAADEPVRDLEAPPQTMHRPAAVPLAHDGYWHYWMQPGEHYRIEHDGTGWRVGCWSWPGDHIYRLADVDGGFATTLPLTTGVLAMQDHRVYLLREARPHRWSVYDITR